MQLFYKVDDLRLGRNVGRVDRFVADDKYRVDRKLREPEIAIAIITRWRIPPEN